MSTKRSDKKYKEFKIYMNNAPVETASGITHELYEMVDSQEIHTISIKNVKKSKHSVEVIIGVIIGFTVPYIAGKFVDIPYNIAVKKIHTRLKNWRTKSPQSTLDIFFDDEKIE